MGNKPQWGHRAKEAVRNKYRGESLKFQPLWDIIDRRWSNQLHQPIHAARYFLIPCYRFSPSYVDRNGEVMEGFSECMQRMVPDIAVRDLIVAEMEVIQNATGKLFSSALAKRGRHTQTPNAWWQNWGGNVPNLQKLALRILCQPCSSSSCEHNWSLFESIHTKKRNKLAQTRLNDLVFVHYNLKLRIRKVMAAATEPLDLDDIDPFGDWTSQDQPSLFTEDEIYELEKEAMEEGGFAVGLDDIQEEGGESEGNDSEHSDSEDEDEDDEESLPGPTPAPPQRTAMARAARPPPSPIVFTRTTGMGKMKM